MRGRNPKNVVVSRIEAQSRRRGSRDTHLDIIVGPLAEQLDVRNLSHGDLLAKTCCASKRGFGCARFIGKTAPRWRGGTKPPRVRETPTGGGARKTRNKSARPPLDRSLAVIMGGKAKPKKHTAKEIAGKVAAATTNKGGGKAGLADRQGGAAGHAKFKCPSCGQKAPSIKSAEMHWDSKHSKLPFVPDDWSDMHALNGGVTTAGVAVKGSSKDKTNHQLSKTQTGQEKLKQIEAQKAAAKFQ
jgi:hypothetical protein